MKAKKSGPIVAGTVMLIIIMFTMNRTDSTHTNPIIGKWKSETEFPNMGKVMNTIEFTQESVSMEGITFSVHYTVEDKRVIVKDEKGTGTVYKIIDPVTMESESMGIKSVYKKLP